MLLLQGRQSMQSNLHFAIKVYLLKYSLYVFCVFQLQDQVSPLSKGRAFVRFIHVGGDVRDEITVKVNKTSKFNYEPFKDTGYLKFAAKRLVKQIFVHSITFLIIPDLYSYASKMV